MNWKLLSLAVLGLSLTACFEKKEEKKAEEVKPAEAAAVEGQKAEAPKAEETPEKKAS